MSTQVEPAAAQPMPTYSISDAKKSLGKVADQVLQDGPALLVRGSKLIMLQEYNPPRPVPVRPPGYFADCYEDPEANALDNLIGEASAKASAQSVLEETPFEE